MEIHIVLSPILSDLQERLKQTFTFQNMFFLIDTSMVLTTILSEVIERPEKHALFKTCCLA